jgi:hypothetical protein
VEVTLQNIALGGVDHIDIDGTDYPVSNEGCAIQKIGNMGITPLVGHVEPRIKERSSYFTVTVFMLENTLENLKLAWSMPNTISYGGTYDYLYLGMGQEHTAHELIVRGWGSLNATATAREWREWYFRKAVSYEEGEQNLGVGSVITIPVTFYCYPDSSQISGQEFGWVRKLA